jgi:iron complex outermembrane receptor protein
MRTRLAAAGLALAISLLFTSVARPAPDASDSQLRQRHRFDIHVQPLSEGLRLLAVQSGMRILFSYDVASSIQGRRVEGFMSTEQALKRLLEGTNLKYSRAGTGVLAMHYRQPPSCAALSAAASAGSPAMKDSTVAMRRGSADAACR